MEKLIGSGSRFLTGIAFLFAIMTISNSCTKSADMNGMGNTTGTGTGTKGGPGTNEVWIQDMSFSPSTITVASGTTITWTNKDPMAHTVTSNTNLFDSGSITPVKTFTLTFTDAGTYSYYCSLHPSMTAKVIVN
jgi:plastocyanin